MRKMTQSLTALFLTFLLLTAPALAEMTSERPDGAFLEDAGGELLETMRTLMADETFAAVLTASEELTAQITAWAESMDAQPLYTRVYPYPELDAALSYVNEGGSLRLPDGARAYLAPRRKAAAPRLRSCRKAPPQIPGRNKRACRAVGRPWPPPTPRSARLSPRRR